MIIDDYSHYAADSRKVCAGSLFFALMGEKSDGHSFLKEAKNKGARGAVVDKHYVGPDFGLKLFFRDAPHSALLEMAKSKLQKTNPEIIGITGSVGKTTTREFLVQLLSPKEFVATKENENTKISVPLTILNEKVQGLYVLEMGMSAPGDIQRLINMAPVSIAILTEISLCHAQNFPSLKALAEEKMKILSKAKKGVIHIKNRSFVEEKSYYTFYGASCADTQMLCERAPHLPSFYYENLHAAFLVARSLGVSQEELLQRASHIRTCPKRFEKISIHGVDFINDAYNGSYLSFMQGASEVLAKNYRKKYVVVSALAEMGRFLEVGHSKMKSLLVHFDHVFCLGDFCDDLSNASCFKKTKELALCLKTYLGSGDLVYIKGSNASGLHTIINTYFRG